MPLTSNSQWIIYRKLDKKWAFLHNGHPAGQISEDVALDALHKLMRVLMHDKDETDEYIIWKFEV